MRYYMSETAFLSVLNDWSHFVTMVTQTGFSGWINRPNIALTFEGELWKKFAKQMLGQFTCFGDSFFCYHALRSFEQNVRTGRRSINTNWDGDEG